MGSLEAEQARRSTAIGTGSPATRSDGPQARERFAVLETEDDQLADLFLYLKAAIVNGCPWMSPKARRGSSVWVQQNRDGNAAQMLRASGWRSYGFKCVGARMTTPERKGDTRRKIQLGGLILKDGLAAEEPAVVLGMLTAT
jgi:hypothetical protein